MNDHTAILTADQPYSYQADGPTPLWVLDELAPFDPDQPTDADWEAMYQAGREYPEPVGTGFGHPADPEW